MNKKAGIRELIGMKCVVAFRLQTGECPAPANPAAAVVEDVDMPLIKMHYIPDGVTLWVNAVDIKSIYSEDYANRVNIKIEMKG